MAVNLPFDVNSFIDQHKATLTADQIAGINELSKGYLREQDYQRNMNTMKTQYQQGFNDNQAWADELKQYEAEAQEALRVRQEVERRFGPVDKFLSTSNPDLLRTPSGDLVSRKDVEALAADFNTKLTAMQQNFAQFAEGSYHMIVKMPSYARQFEGRYKDATGNPKPFDGKAFMDFLDENKIGDPDIGFKLFTATEEGEYSKAETDRLVKEAREQGARDFATRHHIPETSGSTKAFRTPLLMPLKPVTVAPVTTPVVTPVVPAVATPSAADLANATTVPLRDSMQQQFLAAKDQP